VIQAIYKGIEIEMEMHQQAHGNWKCDYTLIKHPERDITINHGAREFATMDRAREYALQEARAAIDQAS
jgi:hypothetical protein